ncbi:MAG: hypothetical protein E6Q97_06085 [Desulfurellales bacterium]|nr:MAG: hypothetical protein E6Q97_06085 [Desulfurellales bacterium]
MTDEVQKKDEPKFISVDRKKLESALSLIAAESRPTIDSMSPPAKPSWYRWQSWQKALIDFGSFAPEIIVHLKPATLLGGNEIASKVNRVGDTIKFTPDAQAAMAKHHISHIEGPFGTLFNLNPPSPSATLAEWQKWTDQLPEPIASRLMLGIWIFRNDDGDQGNE